MVAKPQAKTIKSGRLVKLPIVTRNKEMARTGISNFKIGKNRAYSTVNHDRKFETAVPKPTDENNESQNEEIINL